MHRSAIRLSDLRRRPGLPPKFSNGFNLRLDKTVISAIHSQEDFMTTAIKVPVTIDVFLSQLSLKDKIELVRRLARETRRARWTPLLQRLQTRATRQLRHA